MRGRGQPEIALQTNHERELGMHRQRDFLLLVTVTAAAAAPPLGQTVTPAVGPSNSATQGDAAVPDFSRIWARVSFPGFGRPLAGAGPVINKNRCLTVCFAGGGPLINKNRSPKGVTSVSGYV